MHNLCIIYACFCYVAGMSIDAPAKPDDHPDYALLCEEAIDGDFSRAVEDLRKAAVAAGWRPDTVNQALLNLAHAYSVSEGAPGD